MNQHMRTAWGALRLAFFLGPFLAGLDKFFHLLTNWDMYLSPIAQHVLGRMSHPFMLLVGVIEMAVGIMIITRWTRMGAYIASVWLALIAINLLTTGGFFDIALRDVGLALSAFGLGQLTDGLAAQTSRADTQRRAA